VVTRSNPDPVPGMTLNLMLSTIALLKLPSTRIPRSLPISTVLVVAFGMNVNVTVAIDPSDGALPVTEASTVLPAGVLRQSSRAALAPNAINLTL